MDAAIAALASLQHGVVARWQLRVAAISTDEIDKRISTGRLHILHRGVYAVGHTAVSATGRRLAATLTYGPDAVSSHMGAVSHWQLIPRSKGLDVTVRRQVRPRDGLPVHRLRIKDDEMTVLDGVPVTTVVRTIFDLGAFGRRAVERAMHEAEHRRLFDQLTLEDLLARYPKRKGSGVIRGVLREPQTGRTENDFEEDFLEFLLGRGFPTPRTNPWIEVDGKLIRPDFVFDEQRVIVELDGGTHATTYGRRKDNRRDAALQAAQWRVIRVTWHAFYFTPDDVEADLRRLLQSKFVTLTAV